MLHPSYTDLMEVVNSEVEPGEQPVVQSRFNCNCYSEESEAVD
jgi:DNA-directed RNA polymerase subunit omega